MLRTVLLIDGSEAMNSSADYLPNYLLAMRPPLLRLVERYLDSTPLASLGIIVMRDGVSHRLLPCTTNRNEIVDVLERDVFLHGGSGATSLENGLRMAMSELVDMRKVAALAASSSSSSSSASPTVKNARAAWKGSATQLNILLVSASVTLIDPTDVFSVVNTLAALSVRINVVSLVGAVHVFDVCAIETGGTLYCPLNYDHLLHIVDEVATAHRARAAAAAAKRKREKQKSRQRAKRTRGGTTTSAHGAGDGGGDADVDDDDNHSEAIDAPQLIPIGCPIYLEAPATSASTTTTTEATPTTGSAQPAHYLACPQCHLIQLSVPTTCPLCRLLLCSAPMLYSTYVSHNSLVPAARRLRVVRAPADAANKLKEGGGEGVSRDTIVATRELPVRCSLCMMRMQASAAAAAAAPPGASTTSAAGTRGVASAVTSSSSYLSADGAHVWRCEGCKSVRCDSCHHFVVETLGMCPHCIALQ